MWRTVWRIRGGKQGISYKVPCYYVAAGEATVSLERSEALTQQQAGDGAHQASGVSPAAGLNTLWKGGKKKGFVY